MENKSLNVGQQSLLGYLPAIVIQNIIENKISIDKTPDDWKKSMPQHYMIHTVSLFADISGFTKLGEAFAKKGRIGPEFLAFSLNRYMEQLINIIGKNGGDIFKFAGDALLVIWPESKNNNSKYLSESCQRAVQCALEIQSKLHNQEIAGGKRLAVKVGIGVGECTVLVVGGQFKRCEYLSVGEALAQACECETKALGGGETICHENVKKLIPNVFEYEECTGVDSYGHPLDPADGRFYRIKGMKGDNRIATKADTYLMRSAFSSEKILKNLHVLKSFVPAAISIYLDIEKENWSKEIRLLSIMFLNLTISLAETRTKEGLNRIQNIVNCVQRCIYRTRGALNKFLMDDKGSVMLCCWGLPPISASDDSTRAVYTGLSLIESLKEYDCGALMGITTGTCFTGVCGAMGGRREYSLLGGVVNLSARFMQQSIGYAKDNNLRYLCFVDEVTKELIQSKIVCEYSCEGPLKGFKETWHFFEPKASFRKDSAYHSNNMFPELRTLRNNVPYGKIHPAQKDDKNTYFIKKSLPMIGRKIEFDTCLSDLEQIYKLGRNDIIVVKGVTGSGKSHFIRKVLWQFLESNRELRTKNNNKPLIYCSYQTPISFSLPINGWKNILEDMYLILKECLKVKTKQTFKFSGEKYDFNCDPIGKILFETESYSLINYLNEILNADLKVHFESNPKFEKYYAAAILPPRDSFFDQRKYDKIDGTIVSFLVRLIKAYYQLVNENSNSQQNYLSYPMIFVIEDCQAIDEISLELIKALLTTQDLKGICIICSYQEPLLPLLKNPLDKFYKILEILINYEKEYNLVGFTEESEVSALIQLYLNDTLSITQVDYHVVKLILQKSFKGIPIFIIDLIDSLLAQKLLIYPGQQLICSEELEGYYMTNDWTSFNLPVRFEKIIGNIIDNLTVKEIVILKHAAVIGNIFDLEKLSKIHSFNNVNEEDLYNILAKFENQGLIEFLHNIKQKMLVCKFAIPFFDVVLYQRMLIEQRNDIHLNVARCLQHNKFSYMTQKDEIRHLNKHLKITEKSIINYMEEDDDDKEKKVEHQSFNLNNLKIFYVKEICEKLKNIDLRLGGFEEEISKANNIPFLKTGKIFKKSDKGYSWEERYVAITKSKLYYWYTGDDYIRSKMPLGVFDLKNIYTVDLVLDYAVKDRPYVFSIQVSSWLKKENLRGPRSYYFSPSKKSELYAWVAYLSFLRVKAIYDNFTVQFGQISLPLDYEKVTKKKKIKNKIHIPESKLSQPGEKKYSNYEHFKHLRQYRSDKSSNKQEVQKSKELANSNQRGTVFKRQSVMLSLGENNNEDQEQQKFIKFKSYFTLALSNGFIVLYSEIQDNIFNLSAIGKRVLEKIIFVPTHIQLTIPELDHSLSLTPDNKMFSSPDKIKDLIMNHSPIKKGSDGGGLLLTPNKINEDKDDEDEDDSDEENTEKNTKKSIASDKEKNNEVEKEEKQGGNATAEAFEVNDKPFYMPSINLDKFSSVFDPTKEKEELLYPAKMTSHEEWSATNRNKERTLSQAYRNELLDENNQRNSFINIIKEEKNAKFAPTKVEISESEKKYWAGIDYEAHVSVMNKFNNFDFDNESDEEEDYFKFFEKK